MKKLIAVNLVTLVILTIILLPATLIADNWSVLQPGWWDQPVEKISQCRNQLMFYLETTVPETSVPSESSGQQTHLSQNQYQTLPGDDWTVLAPMWWNSSYYNIASAAAQLTDHLTRLGVLAPTATPVPTATLAPTATPEPVILSTPIITATPEPTPTATPEPTATVELTPSPTPTPSLTPTPKPTPAPTPTLEPIDHLFTEHWQKAGIAELEKAETQIEAVLAGDAATDACEAVLTSGWQEQSPEILEKVIENIEAQLIVERRRARSTIDPAATATITPTLSDEASAETASTPPDASEDAPPKDATVDADNVATDDTVATVAADTASTVENQDTDPVVDTRERLYFDNDCIITLDSIDAAGCRLIIANNSEQDYEFCIHALALNDIMTQCNPSLGSVNIKAGTTGILAFSFTDWLIEYQPEEPYHKAAFIVYAYHKDAIEFETEIISLAVPTISGDEGDEGDTDAGEESNTATDENVDSRESVAIFGINGFEVMKKEFTDEVITISVFNRRTESVVLHVEDLKADGKSAGEDLEGIYMFPSCEAVITVELEEPAQVFELEIGDGLWSDRIKFEK